MGSSEGYAHATGTESANMGPHGGMQQSVFEGPMPGQKNGFGRSGPHASSAYLSADQETHPAADSSGYGQRGGAQNFPGSADNASSLIQLKMTNPALYRMLEQATLQGMTANDSMASSFSAGSAGSNGSRRNKGGHDRGTRSAQTQPGRGRTPNSNPDFVQDAEQLQHGAEIQGGFHPSQGPNQGVRPPRQHPEFHSDRRLNHWSRPS